MLKRHIVLLALILPVLPDVWADRVYKCRDAQGALTYQANPCPKEAQPVSSWNAPIQAAPAEARIAGTGGGVLVLKQQANGHYHLDGAVNGKALTFVVDTGASVITLPQQTAMAAQIYCRDNVLMQTANGTTSVCTSMIPKLEFGPFRVENIPAVIAPNLGQPLFGMNVLRNFKVEQHNGEMRISLER